MDYKKMWEVLRKSLDLRVRNSKDIECESSDFWKNIAFSDILIFMYCLEKEFENDKT